MSAAVAGLIKGVGTDVPFARAGGEGKGMGHKAVCVLDLGLTGRVQVFQKGLPHESW